MLVAIAVIIIVNIVLKLVKYNILNFQFVSKYICSSMQITTRHDIKEKLAS